jgi:hypothetical protein
MTAPPRTIFVTGDVTIDWLLLPSDGERGGAVDFIWMWGGDYSCRALVSAGGAASHADILRRTVEASGRSDIVVAGPHLPAEALASPFHPGHPHTFARIQRFPRRLGEPGHAWRIREFLGTDMTRARATGQEPAAAAAESAPQTVDTLTIVDHAVGYRESCDDLPALLAAGPRHIVWQTGAPLTGSRLAELLLDAHADRLTAITSSDELRKAGAEVGYPLSWEQIAEEIVAAVRAHPLSAARRVIVIIGASGAVIVERGAADVLVFDPHSQESDWRRRHPGVGAGYGRCIDAAVALELAGGEEPALLDAVKRGLAAARVAHVTGLQVGSGPDADSNPFPLDHVAQVLLHDDETFASTMYRPEHGTSILAQTYAGTSLADVAAATALHGTASLPHGIPVETVGAWSSVDRAEIENLRSMRNIVEEYVLRRARGAPAGQPLSLAVFGPPGSGKTFAVRQMAADLLPGSSRRLEFDLSELHSEADLHAAFHEVRDAALEGDLPLVFWDEFDCPMGGTALGWLHLFLSPMQNGRFREGSAYHPLGLAIFVFAGGTAARFDEFVAFGDARAEKAAKKPDFISRLRGYINVTGPNRQDEHDFAWSLRRALLLRSLIAARAPQMMHANYGEPTLAIDDGVLRAFLQVPEYIHGARSMEAIIQMSTLSGKPRFERSSLPAPQQLGVHVDAEEFLRLVRS